MRYIHSKDMAELLKQGEVNLSLYRIHDGLPIGSGSHAEDSEAVGLVRAKDIIEAAVNALHPAWFPSDYNHREAQKAVRAALSSK